MKANVQYNDFIGTVAADISGFIDTQSDKFDAIGKHFEINEGRFKVVGISVSGTDSFNISLICVDKQKSTEEKEHIVEMLLDREEISLNTLFERLHFILYSKFDDNYSDLDCDEEINYSDYH